MQSHCLGTFGSWLLTSATWSMSRCPESKTRTKQVFRVFLSGSDFPSRSWVKLSGLPQVQEKITHVWSRSRDEEGASPKDSRQFDVQRALAYTLGARGNGSPLCRASPCLLVDPHILAEFFHRINQPESPGAGSGDRLQAALWT